MKFRQVHQPAITRVVNVCSDMKQSSHSGADAAAQASLPFLPASSEQVQSAAGVQAPVSMSQAADALHQAFTTPSVCSPRISTIAYIAKLGFAQCAPVTDKGDCHGPGCSLALCML